MKLVASNLKKRKQLAVAADDLGLPAPKHVCCEVADSRSECGSSLQTVNEEDVEVLDMLVESTQDSNSFAGGSHSSTEVIIDAGIQKTDSYDEASTSWVNSRPITSENDSISLESTLINTKGEGMEEYHLPHLNNTSWHDVDCLEECIGTHYYMDSMQHVSGQLEGLLSSSGIPSSDRWTVDREAHRGRQKPTIDQEFEQYFSTLML
ncbi:protein FAR-RED ELONGATED HYPOCOTYL 1-like [Chenopodium quinoa]|uniref:Uncharacterized protein n=1 Tax=Chenopodium quinoa TaxID=63459 RepID=A0A803N936_CHEQI|nr:protein FAR-RED ELONGATED HYPOCOTYL 1-like [Chenopodium quinoa]XP_021744045.1 protein FAR-RED ELONGATED HYPOCOTYL 1-like [Chenopodium quinoa]